MLERRIGSVAVGCKLEGSSRLCESEAVACACWRLEIMDVSKGQQHISRIEIQAWDQNTMYVHRTKHRV